MMVFSAYLNTGASDYGALIVSNSAMFDKELS